MYRRHIYVPLVAYPQSTAVANRNYTDALAETSVVILPRPDELHYRPGIGIGTYPGMVSEDAGHVDNGNNSLLPVRSKYRLQLLTLPA
jgi:hypothetical protein